jgi:bla regulator protein BlaR1
MKRLRLGVLVAVAISVALGQAQRPSFEVASVKVNNAHDGRFSFDYPAGGGFTAKNCTLRVLIQIAYDLRDYQQPDAPGWISQDGFDVAAKPATGSAVSREQTRMMLQQLLEERFHMTTHRETVQRQVYSLIVGKNGHKLSAEGSIAEPMKTMIGDLVVSKMNMSALATIIGFDLKRPVLDETGLKGDFAFRLQWARGLGESGGEDPSKPSIFAAVQEQLGLKLNSTTGPIEVLVIDSVNRTPVEN